MPEPPPSKIRKHPAKKTAPNSEKSAPSADRPAAPSVPTQAEIPSILPTPSERPSPPSPDPGPAYAELHTVTNFSFLRGASHPDELVEEAKKLGYGAIAITDENSLAGVVRAHVAAKSAGIAIIVGTEMRFESGRRVVLLAHDRAAYGRLVRLISTGRRRAPKGTCRLTEDDLVGQASGLSALALVDDEALWPRVPEHVHTANIEHLARIRDIFGDRAALATSFHEGPDDRIRLERYEKLAEISGLPPVATGAVDAHLASRRIVRDVLWATHYKTSIDRLGKRMPAHGVAPLRPRTDIARLFRGKEDWIARSCEIAARCTFSLGELRYEYPDDGKDRDLREIVFRSALLHWPDGMPDRVRALVEHELALIAELRYEPYFLTVYDIMQFARSRGILCQGRGSAANSAVCFCLGITAVDPARFDVLFERFISRDRNEPPDIDVDFEHERREEVLQWIYERYGRERAALAATLITYRGRSAVRDTGKALGLALDQVDRLSKAIEHWHDIGELESRLAERGFDANDPSLLRVLSVARQLQGFPRHLSQHVGGMVITKGRLDEVCPIENAAMQDRTVIQWDKDDLDALGILKIDCLSLGMLTAIRKAFTLIEDVRGKTLTLANIPAESPAVYAMAQKADTVGVFQIESRAQMAMLPRFLPVRFYDLVIEVALVRPGPIQGGMVHPYLRRRAGLEKVTFPSEAVRSVLEKTLGVPIFQEQVMKLAVVAAGFTPGEADMLRRAMGAWRRPGLLQNFRDKLINGMLERGYEQKFAEAVFEQIKGFGEYGFPESHAASFALLTYISCWLKRMEPAAFATALLNSQPMGFYSPSQIVRDARAHGVVVRPVDVTKSTWDSGLEIDDPEHLATTNPDPDTPPHTWGRGGPAIRLGFSRLKGFRADAAERIVWARSENPFTSVDDVVRRAALDRRHAVILAEAGAFLSLTRHRRDAFWQAGVKREEAPLFEGHLSETQPEFEAPTLVERTLADYGLSGLSLNAHPMQLLRPFFKNRPVLDARGVAACDHGCTATAAGLVICRQRPATASGILFVTLEDETGFINLVVRIAEQERYRIPLLGGSLLLVRGKIERDGAVVHLVASFIEDLTQLLHGLTSQSRDFH